MGHLAVRLLGSFQVSLDGEPVTGFRSDKVRALLAYLCVEMARPHRRERVAGLLWPELPERSARSNLRHALTNLRTLLGERDSASPFLIATRQTVQIDPDSNVWVDALVLADQAGGDLAALEQAVDLYRGEFMEGFSLADSPDFEEWVLFQRERFQRLMMEALTRLAEGLEAQDELERALAYARRQVDMDPWREKAHRQVMRLLALSGQRAAALAQYESCRHILAEGLGVEPSGETVALARRIREGEPGAAAISMPRPTALAAEPPPFLELEVPEAEPALFVGRERELVRLQEHLEQALIGEGRTIFVTGGPGRGKTALLSEFARQAMEAQPDLLVAKGSCSALAGIGDVYLPFREIMAMLTGDLEARWYAGSITRDHAQRLWGALPRTAQALLEHGPNVVGTLVRGPAFLSRATAAVGSRDGAWLRRLGDLVRRRGGRAEGMEQAFLFEQLTNSLRCLAEHHPLLLVLDDLHWADRTSSGLLFHLGSRLRGSRILLASAYRPEEVASLDRSEDHPLHMALAELKRRYGDVWVDLAAIGEEEARAFVNALIDSEPNWLGGEFRDAMFRRTGGHPLFVVELLRAMQTRGDLVKDGEGQWIEGPELRWDLLPERVEGVIEARIGRLSPELRDILAAASVEGDEFTAQVVARVQHLDERAVLRSLTGDLDQRYRLVRASRETRAGQHHLTHYRFSHVLFGDYLYGALGPGERSLLHREVGTALEDLHEGQLEEISARLALHFAADPDKGRRYARMAGEWSAAQYANEEAIRYLTRALELTPDDDLEERYALLLARERLYDRQGDRQQQREDLAGLEELAKTLLEPHRKVEVALRRSQYAWVSGELSPAVALAEAAIELLEGNPDPKLEARARRRLALAFLRQGQSMVGEEQLELALELARQAGDRWLEAEVLRHLGNQYAGTNRLAEARDCLEASRSIFQEVGDRFDEVRIRYSLNILSFMGLEYGHALRHAQASLRLSREVGWRSMESNALNASGCVQEACGEYETARDSFARCLEITRDTGERGLEGVALTNLASVDLASRQYRRALMYAGQALATSRETGQHFFETIVLGILGRAHHALGELSEARSVYQETLDLLREIDQSSEAGTPLAGLALLCLDQGDLPGALVHVDEILSYWDGTAGPYGANDPLSIYWACYRVLHAATDPRAEEVLEEAHSLLQETAAKIDDEQLRRSFLGNVTAHRELSEEYQRLHGAS
jgi:DNA-binding SARP family transcriptional activator/predicted ATPase